MDSGKLLRKVLKMINYKAGYLLEISILPRDDMYFHTQIYDGLSKESAEVIFKFSSEFGENGLGNKEYTEHIIDVLFQKYGESFDCGREEFLGFVEEYRGYDVDNYLCEVIDINLYYLPEPIAPYLVKSI
jgi:hypothetical protein